MKFLIVDDHEQMREMMRDYVQQWAKEICECADGFDAIDCYEEHRPDWVLMDLEMKRMDGLEATRRIIKKHSEAQILVVTQYDDRELRRAAAEAGAIGFITKDNLNGLRQYLE